MKLKKIKTKLLLSYLIFVLVVILVGVFSSYSVSSVNENGNDLYDNRLKPTMDLTYIAESSGNVRVLMVQALLREDAPMTRQALVELDKIDELLESYEKSKMVAEEKEAFEEFKHHWGIFNSRVKANAALMESGNFAEADKGITLGKDEYNTANDKLNELVAINEAVAADLIKENNDAFKRIQLILLVSIIGVTIIALGISTIIGNTIGNSVKSVLEKVTLIANGDLTSSKLELKSKDELGQLAEGINAMQKSLNELVVNAAHTSEQVSASAEELSASAEQSTLASEQLAALSQHSAEGASTQLKSVNEVSDSLLQLTSSIQQIAVSSAEMQNVSENASGSTVSGAKTVQDVVEQMTVISEIVGTLSVQISHLDQKSKEIGNITTIITSISEQTNLLALNAAIEAARAGDQGKGFAVVADEVRKLAEESKKSALLISGMVNEIQMETTSAVASMENGNEKVEAGITLSRKAIESFEDIQRLIGSVSDSVQEVSASIQEIASVGENIVESSEKVKEIAETSASASQESSAATEEQLATMEEVASSAQALSSLAEDLQTLISKFKV
jgi:methyl-accepting chemotaxis protein